MSSPHEPEDAVSPGTPVDPAELQAAMDAIVARGPVGHPGTGAAPTEGRVGDPEEGLGEDDLAPRDPERAKAYRSSLNILAGRDHTKKELRDKLLRKDFDPELVATLVDDLEASRLIDESAYAVTFVRSGRAGKGLSISALRRGLKDRGVGEEDIAEALSGVEDEEEYELAFRVALKKAATTRGLPRETRMRRILGLLARRGFPGALAGRAARAAIEEEPGFDEEA